MAGDTLALRARSVGLCMCVLTCKTQDEVPTLGRGHEPACDCMRGVDVCVGLEEPGPATGMDSPDLEGSPHSHLSFLPPGAWMELAVCCIIGLT